MTSPARLMAFALALGAQAAMAQPAAGASAAPASGIRTGADCQAHYPAAALKAKAEGTTKLQLAIDAAGRIDSAQVVESAGLTPEHKLLDNAVVRSLTGCTLWQPRRDVDGHPIPYTLSMSYVWRLPNADGSSSSKARPLHLASNDPTCRPIYPPAALRSQAQGTTVLGMTVDSTGRVTSTEVRRSAGTSDEHRLLDQAAAESLARCPVTPGTDENGRPIGSQIELAYHWRLD